MGINPNSNKPYMPPKTLTQCITPRSAGILGEYSLTKIWPTDLACDDPQGILPCEYDVVRAATVGGFRTKVVPDPLDVEGLEEVPAVCLADNAEAAWLRVWQWRPPTGDFYVGEFETSPSPNAVGGIVTFVPMDSTSFVRLSTIDNGLAQATFDCPGTPPAGPTDVDFSSLFGWVAGGTFKGSVGFLNGCTRPTPVGVSDIELDSVLGSEDAFLSVHLPNGYLYTSTQQPSPPPHQRAVLRLGSTGPDAILGICYNMRLKEIVVCGYFGGGDLDFDPLPPVPGGNQHTAFASHAGGKDLFVASYTLEKQALGTIEWHLNWLHAHGTSEDEQAEGVWADLSDTVYVTGWRTVGGSKQAILTRLDPDHPCLIPGCYEIQPTWSNVIHTTGTVQGLDVCVDGIGRPIVTGDFSGTVAFPASYYNTTSSISLTSAGGTDGFVGRFDPFDGKAQWVYKVGGAGNDTSTDVAVCQFNSARLVHGGNFVGSNVDFNPDPAVTAPLTAANIDSFVNVFEHVPEGTPKRHITLAFDGKTDPEASAQCPGPGCVVLVEDTDWVAQSAPVAAALRSTDFNTSGDVSLQVLTYDVNRFGVFAPTFYSNPDPVVPNNRRAVVQRIPILTIRSADEAELVARRLESLGAYYTFGDNTNLNGYGILSFPSIAAAHYFGMPLDVDPLHPNPPMLTNLLYKVYSQPQYRHIVFPLYYDYRPGSCSNPPTAPFLAEVARNAIENQSGTDPYLDQFNAFALDYDSNPDYCFRVTREDIVGSPTPGQFRLVHSPITYNPTADGDWSLGLAARAPDPDNGPGVFPSPWQSAEYLTLMPRMMVRMCWCPSDYDRNGASTNTGPNNDLQQFIDAYGSLNPYSDWNLDGLYTGSGSGTGDGTKFENGFSSGCP